MRISDWSSDVCSSDRTGELRQLHSDLRARRSDQFVGYSLPRFHGHQVGNVAGGAARHRCDSHQPDLITSTVMMRLILGSHDEVKKILSIISERKSDV